MTGYFFQLEMNGSRAFKGVEHIRFGHYNQPTTYLRLTDCIGRTPAAIVSDLSSLGFNVLGRDGQARIQEYLSHVSCFPTANILDRTGWIPPYYALPKGQVIAPAGAEKMRAVFKKQPQLNERAGTGKDWKRTIGRWITDQPLLIWTVGLLFAAPLARIAGLHRGLAFEFVDESGTGSDILPLISASVSGSLAGASVSFGVACADAARQHLLHADGLMVVEDPRPDFATMALARARAAAIDFLRNRPSSVGGDTAAGPVSVLIVSRGSIVDQIGAASTAGQAVADDLITLRVPSGQPHGLFASIPEGFDSLSGFVGRLQRAVQANHGVPLRRYLRHVVQAYAEDPSVFHDRIIRLVAMFRRHSCVDENDTRAVSVVNTFGLVYAGLRLAEAYGVVPKGWRCGPAVMAVYRHYHDSPEPLEPADEVIRALAARDGIMRLSRGKRYKTTTIREAKIFMNLRMGRRELLIDPDAADEFLPGGEQFLRRADVRPFVERDGAHYTVWRRLKAGTIRKRMICLRLPRKATP